MTRGLGLVVVGVLALSPAHAGKPKKGPSKQSVKKVAQPEGIALVATLTHDKGYVDDPLAFDAAGGRLATIHTDGASVGEILVHDLADQAKVVATIDIAAVTLTPDRLRWVGDRLLVTWPTDTGES